MRNRFASRVDAYLVVATCLAVFLSSSGFVFAQDEPAESAQGLLGEFRDGETRIDQVVPLPNFALAPTDSVHPQIGTKFSAVWRGRLRIDRAGEYRVFAKGASVLIKGAAGESMQSLSTGEHPIVVKYERKPGVAALQLLWESQFFRTEPVPSRVLRHKVVSDLADNQRVVEHGRLLFAELGCANCHKAEQWRLQSRRGPDLSTVGSRVNSGWLFEWLREPRHFRDSAVMPVSLETAQDRADVTAFVMSMKVQDENSDNAPGEAQLSKGKELFNSVGCTKCHDKTNHLDFVGSKYSSLNKLAEFIGNPHATDPHGRMPSMFRDSERHLALAIAAYLFKEKQRDGPYKRAPSGDAKRGAKLFASHGCSACHAANHQALADAKSPAAPAFGPSSGLALRNYWDFDYQSALDSASNRQDRIEGAKKFSQGVGKEGRAFEFDGRSYIEVPHFHRPNVMTISVWVKTTRGGSIITWGRPGGGRRGSRELRMNIGQDGKNSVCYGEYNSDGGWKPVVIRPKDVNLIDGQWHHLAVVRDGEEIKHYIDGKLKGSGKTQKDGGDYTDRVLIGALGLQSNPSNRFSGSIDELSVWEVALSAAQVERLAAGSKPIELARPKEKVVAPFDIDAGCLAESVKRPLPDYRLKQNERAALKSFLASVHPKSGRQYRHAPTVVQNMRMQQFGCIKCHELNDQNIQKGMQIDDRGQIVRVERPPRLTAAGSKLTSSWINDVLSNRKRNRPWLRLRMPHFGESVGDVADLIVSSAGVSANETGPKPDRKLAEAGLAMIGVRRGKVACITCHDYRGINRRKDGVVPAPDLAEAGRTVRYEWFNRWMHDPQRLQPGTSMPQLFLDVSKEEREQRIAQLWSALYYQRELPLPKGSLSRQTEGTRIVVKDKPVIFRMATVTPVGQINRAINVGIPGGMNYTFDPVSCQIRYVWKGAFLDAGPAWNGRGGNPVRAGGESLLAIKSGHFVEVGAAKRRRFSGYRLEGGLPVFRYRINDAEVEHRVAVVEGRLTQRITVKNADSDVRYVGNSASKFEASGGQRDGDAVQFPKAEKVEFSIEVLLKN